jgi:ammonium transporter, Amt family
LARCRVAVRQPARLGSGGNGRGAEAAAEVVENRPRHGQGRRKLDDDSTVLVLFMTIPGLALFYGGLVRSKNMLSILMQTTVIACVMMMVWVFYGYSFAFGGSTSPGGAARASCSCRASRRQHVGHLLGGLRDPGIPLHRLPDDLRGHHAGADHRRLRRTGEVQGRSGLLGPVGHLLYFPIAHMVWDANGYLFAKGAIDFAGGTVVHINAGIAALVGCIVIGQRVGYGKDNMAPHSMV